MDGDGEFGISLNDLPLKKNKTVLLLLTDLERYNTNRIIISWVYNFVLGYYLIFNLRIFLVVQD